MMKYKIILAIEDSQYNKTGSAPLLIDFLRTKFQYVWAIAEINIRNKTKGFMVLSKILYSYF